MSSAAYSARPADGGIARQRRQDDDPERHADHPDRDLEQRERDC